MRDVKLLLPDPAVLDYMKRQEKYINRHMQPLKADLASISNRYQLVVSNIAETQASYIEDCRCIHQLCDLVSRLPEERRRRNEDKIKTDLTALVNQANPKEDILIKAKEEFEGSVASVKDKVREMALKIKEIQIDSADEDYDIMLSADQQLAEILLKICVKIKDLANKIENSMKIGFDVSHKRKIEDEYARRGKNLDHLYNSTWKPFNEQIQMFDQDEDQDKVRKMYKSFKHLIESIEWSFDAENIENSYLPILSNMQRMHDLILAKRQEIEYSRVRPDDCQHPMTAEFIVFYQKIIGQSMSILADLFYGNPAHKSLIEVLQIRSKFFEQIKLNFLTIKGRFLENKKNYFVGEFWRNMSSRIYDFLERVYTSNVHQKMKINECVVTIMRELRHNLDYMVREINQFHDKLDSSISGTNANYQRLLGDNYNLMVLRIKDAIREQAIRDLRRGTVSAGACRTSFFGTSPE